LNHSRKTNFTCDDSSSKSNKQEQPSLLKKNSSFTFDYGYYGGTNTRQNEYLQKIYTSTRTSPFLSCKYDKAQLVREMLETGFKPAPIADKSTASSARMKNNNQKTMHEYRQINTIVPNSM
jgi:hypothetical protein